MALFLDRIHMHPVSAASRRPIKPRGTDARAKSLRSHRGLANRFRRSAAALYESVPILNGTKVADDGQAWSVYRRWGVVVVSVLAMLVASDTAMNKPNVITGQDRTRTAIDLMTAFAERTGLSSAHAQQRYLWTDAFAVCNFLELAVETSDEGYKELALRLVDQVHHTLGRHRADDERSGWISGLGAEAGEQHPTQGGLRIGKTLQERAAGEPFNERLEWDRDGQYFHYLTQWMHALDQVARSTGRPTFNLWARELADVAFRRFTYVPPDSQRRRMRWKMSIDLSRPLVSSMGQHDPLDGAIVYAELEATAVRLPPPSTGPRLGEEIAELATIVQGENLATTDPLGLGGLLIDAFRVQQLMRQGAIAGDELLQSVLAAALIGLRAYAQQDELQLPATRRLAFRELGLAIGLHGVALMSKEAQEDPASIPKKARAPLASLEHYVALGTAIESFWLEPAHRRASTWTEHRNINDVMLATSLLPKGFLVAVAVGRNPR
jgi:hypothetical protein